MVWFVMCIVFVGAGVSVFVFVRVYSSSRVCVCVHMCEFVSSRVCACVVCFCVFVFKGVCVC